MERIEATLALFICAALAMGAVTARAEPLPTAPMLRLESWMHTGTIKRNDVDAAGKYIVTCSPDKTARVWEVDTGLLAKVLRPPAGKGGEGSLEACAISPDGTTVATGGKTRAGGDSYVVYLFNLSSGEIKQRITGLDDVLTHLTYSPAGKYLGATTRSGSVKVWDVKGGYAQVLNDSSCTDRSYGCAFSGKKGYFATSCFDGKVRLYNRKFKLVKEVATKSGKQPSTLDFSPDCRKLAVTYDDRVAVDIYSVPSLNWRHSTAVLHQPGDRLGSVAWSRDGRRLFAGGRYSRDGGFPILEWQDRGVGSQNLIKVSAQDTIRELHPLGDGRLHYASADPLIAVLDPHGRKLIEVKSSIPVFTNIWAGNFALSHDGDVVEFGLDKGGQRPVRFHVAERRLEVDLKTGHKMSPPVISAEGISVQGWKPSKYPALNGNKLPTSPYEISRSLAVVPGGGSFLLGTSSRVMHLGKDGSVIWSTESPGSAWGVNVSGDGRLAVAALADGTVRWYSMADGKELLSLFVKKSAKGWVAWTPSGYYAASPGGEEMIGWQVNRGPDAAADFFPASRFRDIYYRPDVIEKVLVAAGERDAIREADEAAGRKETVEVKIEQRLPPVITILSPGNGYAFSSHTVTVQYQVRNPAGEQITGLEVLLDGRPAGKNRGLTVKSAKGVETIEIPVPARDVAVSLVASNRLSTSEPATVRLAWKGKEEEFVIKPKLYVLAIGVTQYEKESLRLRFAAKDARDFAAALEAQKGKLYRDVITKVAEDASRDDVLDGLEWIEREVTAKDVAMVFLAGHGVNDRNGDYVFLPVDGDPERLRRTGIPYGTVRDVITGLPGKVLLFVDTCHSGDIMGSRRGVADIDRVVMDLTSAENGVVVFAASPGPQYSVEHDDWGNGAFTRALIEALSGKADFRKTGRITLNMIDLYISERVKELTKGQQTPTTSKPRTIQDFPVVLTR